MSVGAVKAVLVPIDGGDWDPQRTAAAITQTIHLLEGRAVERQACGKRLILERKQVGIAEVLDERNAMTRSVVDDGRHAEFCLFEKLGDRNKLRVVLAFFGPVDADEGFLIGSLDAHDRAARRATFDGDERNGDGRVHAEELSGGGEDRFGWHGRPHNRVETSHCAKGKSGLSCRSNQSVELAAFELGCVACFA